MSTSTFLEDILFVISELILKIKLNVERLFPAFASLLQGISMYTVSTNKNFFILSIIVSIYTLVIFFQPAAKRWSLAQSRICLSVFCLLKTTLRTCGKAVLPCASKLPDRLMMLGLATGRKLAKSWSLALTSIQSWRPSRRFNSWNLV